MREPEMEEIADLMTRIVVEREDSHKVASDVSEFRRPYQKVHYAFETSKDAYTYIHIR
jgi:glycine hydroxymethyltransferase